MPDENWTIQVSFKTPGDSLINVRVVEPLALPTHLGVLRDTLEEIISTEQLAKGASNAGPLVQSNATPTQAPQQPAQPAQPAQVQPAQGATPTCAHGQMTFKSGTSNRGPWSGWMCPQKNRDCTIWND